MESSLQAKYPLGDEVPISYVPYLIFLSYVVSLIGAITTVELLHRRASRSGWRAWIQIGSCAVSFGLVAIWCMHFVGNRAIILGDGEQEIQLYYSASYTTVSAILPIVVIFLGLLSTDRLYKGSRRSLTRYCALLICGVCGGAAVTEMHYLGNNGTTNYRLRLSWPHVVGAASIAVGACLISFTLFFHWSSHWMNNIWRRLLVACFLAVAVSGMHWTAAVGTFYELRGYHGGSGQARNTNIIIALCLSLGACVVCFALGWLEQRHRKKVKDRAQQVVLALATFDDEGRILVTQGGLLPCQTITQQFHQRTFNEDFNTSHPVFQWLFRVSQNWAGIIELIPAMREHLRSTGYIRSNSSIGGTASRSSFGSDDHSSYSATFRELFCVTAHEIARSLDTSIQNLGSLYEDVLTTGTLVSKTTWKDVNGSRGVITVDAASPKDIEAGIANPIMFGKGQLLVLTKKVNTTEANRLQNAGYRFATLEQIGDHLARSLQISREDLDLSFNRMQQYCEREVTLPMTGTYLASFLLQASPGVGGLNVIVPKLTPDRLPMVKLSPNELDTKQQKLLSLFNGLSLDGCLARIAQRSNSSSDDDIFLNTFRSRINQLLQDVPEPILRQAVFSSQQLDLAHGMAVQNKHSQARVYAFCGIKEVYSQSLESPMHRCIPLSFFRTYLRTYPGCSDHAILAQKNHKEFSAFLTPSDTKSLRGRKPSKWWQITRSPSPDPTLKPDSSSEKGLVNFSTNLHDPSNNNHPFGGIMVSQEVVINEDHKEDGVQLELRELGVRTEAGVADAERLTLADRLMAITASFRDLQATGQLPDEDYQRR